MQPVFWGSLAHSFRHLDFCSHICRVMSDSGGCFIKAVITHIHAPYKLKESVRMQEGIPLDLFSVVATAGYLKKQLKMMPIFCLTTLKLEVGHRSHRAKSRCPQGCVLTQEKNPFLCSFRLSAESSSLWSQLPASLMAVSQGCTWLLGASLLGLCI